MFEIMRSFLILGVLLVRTTFLPSFIWTQRRRFLRSNYRTGFLLGRFPNNSKAHAKLEGWFLDNRTGFLLGLASHRGMVSLQFWDRLPDERWLLFFIRTVLFQFWDRLPTERWLLSYSFNTRDGFFHTRFMLSQFQSYMFRREPIVCAPFLHIFGGSSLYVLPSLLTSVGAIGFSRFGGSVTIFKNIREGFILWKL
jgi:hypothetical protein